MSQSKKSKRATSIAKKVLKQQREGRKQPRGSVSGVTSKGKQRAHSAKVSGRVSY